MGFEPVATRDEEWKVQVNLLRYEFETLVDS